MNKHILAAVEAARKNNSTVTIVSIQPAHYTYDELPEEEAHELAYLERKVKSTDEPAGTEESDNKAAMEELLAKIADRDEKIESLNAKVSALVEQMESQKAAAVAAAPTDNSAALQSKDAEIAELKSQLAAAQKIVSDSPAVAVAAIPTAMSDMSIADLGLSEKTSKHVNKLKLNTVAELSAAFSKGEFAQAERRVPKDARLEIAHKLLGQGPAVQAPAVIAGTSNGDDTVPEKLTPPTWARRLEALKKRESMYADNNAETEKVAAEVETVRGKIEACRADVAKTIDELDALPQDDTSGKDQMLTAKLNTLNANLSELQAQHGALQQKHHALQYKNSELYGQTLAFAWMLGFDPARYNELKNIDLLMSEVGIGTGTAGGK